MYCAPRKGSRFTEEDVSGLYVELAQFGCGKGITPGLESRVARQAALCPSLELERDGVTLDGMKPEIAYLQKHGEAGRLSYPHFRKLGIPLGSGAIESGIRRVINLRLKSNAMFWREPNAESMLQVRAQVLSNRWDERVQEMRKLRRSDGSTDWTWQPRAMNVKTKAENASAL